jgi:glycosyltransferase involved in cell wall biosynthesis
LKKPYCCTTHYGYILKPHLWERGYDRIYKDTLRAPGIIALSGEIAATYRSSGYEGFLRVIRNGADVPSFKFTREGNQKAICLGKIEPRKQQALLAQLLEGQSQIDFVGPLVDREFKENRTCRYLGVWDKPYLLEHLTDYNCLVLFSVGEASPLVVPEALAAGLSLVISESASANLDAKEFITVLPDKVAEPKTIRDAINSQIQSNSGFRQQIREYALARFSWAVIMREYEVLTREFIELRPKAARKTRMESVDWNLRRLRTKLMSWHRR